MPTFSDLDEFFQPGLELTIGGKVYTIDPPTAELGLWLERMMATVGDMRTADTEAKIDVIAERIKTMKPPAGFEDDADRSDLYRLILGRAYDELMADCVAWPKVKFAHTTAFVWMTVGEAAAAAWWSSGGRPEALAPNRAQRRAMKNTAGEKETQQPDSTNGTNSLTTSNPDDGDSPSPGGTS